MNQVALEPQNPKKSTPPARTWIDRNIASLGLFSAANKRTGKKRTVRLPSRTDAQGNRLQRRITISPNAELKEPIIQDLNFFMAFMEIAQEQRNRSGGVLKNPIGFTPYQLFKRLNYRSTSNRNYQLVEEWLHRMTGTLIISQNALERVDQALFLNAGFVLFQGVITRGEKLPSGDMANKCYVWLHDWQVANINSNHSLPLFENYKNLKHRIAKALVLLLPGWFYASKDQGCFEKDYLDFCQILGLQPKHFPSKIREKHGAGLDELITWGHLSTWDLVESTHGKKFKIVLYPGPRYTHSNYPRRFPVDSKSETGAEPETPKEQSELSKPTDRETDPALVKRLAQWGISERDAQKLLANLPTRAAHEKIEYAEQEIRRLGLEHDPKSSPAGFMVKRLQENAPTPENFVSERKRRELAAQAERQRKEQQALEQAYQAYVEAQTQAYINEHYTPEQYQALVRTRLMTLEKRLPQLSDGQRTAIAESAAREDVAGQIPNLKSFAAFCEDQNKQN